MPPSMLMTPNLIESKAGFGETGRSFFGAGDKSPESGAMSPDVNKMNATSRSRVMDIAVTPYDRNTKTLVPKYNIKAMHTTQIKAFFKQGSPDQLEELKELQAILARKEEDEAAPATETQPVTKGSGSPDKKGAKEDKGKKKEEPKSPAKAGKKAEKVEVQDQQDATKAS